MSNDAEKENRIPLSTTLSPKSIETLENLVRKTGLKKARLLDYIIDAAKDADLTFNFRKNVTTTELNKTEGR